MKNRTTWLSVSAMAGAMMLCIPPQTALAGAILLAPDVSFTVREDIPGVASSRLLDDTPLDGFWGFITDSTFGHDKFFAEFDITGIAAWTECI